LLAVLQRLRYEKIEFTSARIPIHLRIPAFLLQRMNTFGDLSELVYAEVLNGAFDLFDPAHTFLL